MIHVAVKVKWQRNTVRAGKAEEREGCGVEINCDIINTIFKAFRDISAWDIMTQSKEIWKVPDVQKWVDQKRDVPMSDISVGFYRRKRSKGR